MTEPIELSMWVATLAARLDLDPADVDVEAVLDLAADAAHAVIRPAAPLTTFMAGLAAGRNGGGAEAIGAALRTCSEAAGAAADS